MEARPSGKRTCLYTATQLDAVLDTMALQVAGLLVGKQRIMLVGILRRGAPLAEMLHKRLSGHFSLANIPLMNLQIKRYSDDFGVRAELPTVAADAVAPPLVITVQLSASPPPAPPGLLAPTDAPDGDDEEVEDADGDA